MVNNRCWNMPSKVAFLEKQVALLKDDMECQRITAKSQQDVLEGTIAEAQHALAAKEAAIELRAQQHMAEMRDQAAEADRHVQSLAAEHACRIKELQEQNNSALLEQQIQAEARLEEFEDQLAALRQRFDARQAEPMPCFTANFESHSPKMSGAPFYILLSFVSCALQW